MAKFKSREEYESWKAQKIQEGKTSKPADRGVPIDGIKTPRRIFCPKCGKENDVEFEIFNCKYCGFNLSDISSGLDPYPNVIPPLFSILCWLLEEAFSRLY
jgi:hypothetical protein